MNQIQHGFCQKCHTLVELIRPEFIRGGERGGAGIAWHDHAGESPCPGSFHQPATLVLGPGWISWTIAATSFSRSVLIDPMDPQTMREHVRELERARRMRGVA